MMETYQYILRAAKVDDATELASMAKRGLPGYPFEYIYNPEKIAEEISEGSDYRIVAHSAPQGPLGTAVLELPGPMSEIKRVVVDPQVRRNGVAKSMTEHLANEAAKRGLVAWSDVRADQIGMQRSALSAGLKPVCLEQGKHVVYQHWNQNGDLGAARETMIHMTTLNLQEEKLIEGLHTWSYSLRQRLLFNIEQALSPTSKVAQVIEQMLPSAKQAKARIELAVSQVDVNSTKINDDIEIIDSEGNQLLIIKPDVSGFLLSPPNQNLGRTLSLAQDLGLQLVTYYTHVMDHSAMSTMAQEGMEPWMVRPWQPSNSQEPRWEVGWRKPLNGYQESLHMIQLDEGVEKPIRQFMERLKTYVI